MIIVTGGYGFIGSHLALALACGDEEVVVVDTPEARSRYHGPLLEVADFVSSDRFFSFINARSPTSIYHLGAISSTTAHGAPLFQTNTDLTVRLWKWCGRNEVPLLYASSAATYGDGSLGFSDEMTTYEMMELRPLNPYGMSKHLADLACMVGHDQCLFRAPPRWYGMKFFNVYGPGEAHKKSQRSIISHWVTEAVHGRRLPLFAGTALAMRDFVAVSDVVEVMLWLMDQKPASGIYNIGTSVARSFRDVADIVGGIYSVEIEPVPFPSELASRYQWHTQATAAKLIRAGYPGYPMKTVEEGILACKEDAA